MHTQCASEELETLLMRIDAHCHRQSYGVPRGCYSDIYPHPPPVNLYISKLFVPIRFLNHYLYKFIVSIMCVVSPLI